MASVPGCFVKPIPIYSNRSILICSKTYAKNVGLSICLTRPICYIR
jgi:hypothetical protein